jgi:hypothetical protein
MSGRGTWTVLLLTLWVGVACARHSAPPDFLPNKVEVQEQSFGGWVDLVLRSEQEDRSVAGELIAATADSLWVMSGSTVVVVPVTSVASGQLAGYDSESGQVVGAVALGAISTISNGFFLVFTAPMWLIGGSIAANSQGKVGLEDLPPMQWAELARFARFPQGIPASLDLRELRPRAR